MPLYGDNRQDGVLDALDDIVAGTADRKQIFTQSVYGLMMC